MLKDLKAWLYTIVLFAALIVCLISLPVLVYCIITGFQVPVFFRTLSNVLFFPGMLVICIGAFIEFFTPKNSPDFARILMRPYESRARRLSSGDGGKSAAAIEYHGGGWMIIAIGVLVVIVSAVLALASVSGQY